MSLDSSLKSSGNLSQHRNVLTRAERIDRLTKRKAFDADKTLGLPKVANRKVATGKKVKKAPGEADAAATPAAAPAAAAAKPAGKPSNKK
ncbi:MAG: small basic protein [Phycisphaeraceae bacterium]